jgi:PIN domain nuclease of toxin-antitoxin system
VNLLLDSHALLWALHAPDQLRPAARAAIESPENAVFYSAGSAWELALKVAKGKLVLPRSWLEAARATGFQELPITSADGVASAKLPWHHSDPFDRMFIAQAKRHRLRFATRDSVAALYGADLLPV